MAGNSPARRDEPHQDHGQRIVDDDRFDRGAALLTRLTRGDVPPPWESFADIAPVLGHSVGVAFGTIIDRPGLDLRTRELVTIAVLATLGGCEPQIAFHVGAALQAGATAPEVVEMLTQLSVYAGVPRALNAVAAARPVFAGAGVSGAADAPRAVTLTFWDAVAAGDIETAAGLLHAEARWEAPDTDPGLPFSGNWRRPEPVAEFLQCLSETVRRSRVVRGDALPAAECVYVPFWYHTGPATARAVLQLEVQDALIFRATVFHQMT